MTSYRGFPKAVIDFITVSFVSSDMVSCGKEMSVKYDFT